MKVNIGSPEGALYMAKPRVRPSESVTVWGWSSPEAVRIGLEDVDRRHLGAAVERARATANKVTGLVGRRESSGPNRNGIGVSRHRPGLKRFANSFKLLKSPLHRTLIERYFISSFDAVRQGGSGVLVSQHFSNFSVRLQTQRCVAVECLSFSTNMREVD